MKKICQWRRNFAGFLPRKVLLVMRLSLGLFLLVSFQTIASVTYSQDTKVTVKMNHAQVKEVLKEIERSSGFYFVYNNELIDVERVVNVEAKNQKIKDILDALFSDEGVSYTVIGRQIVLSPEELMAENMIQPQEKTVRGTVTDQMGEPIPGVTVTIKGTTRGTITDVDGNFSLSIPADAEVLVFSFIGMQTQEIPVGDNMRFDVVMEEKVVGLDEVVVVGYGTQQKATLTGAIGIVKAEEMAQRPAANTSELLQGQIAGLVTRQSSGLPGSDATTLNIRGFGNPLVIVDGVYSGIAQIDPNDIESVSVLKDASAAVYGARAGNGVILVTTKRGSDKPPQITYHGTVSVTQPTFLADNVGAREWAEMMHESGVNPDNYSPGHVHYDPETKRLINLVDDSDYVGYDWQKALYRDWTPQSQHNISVRGGNDKIKYFVSAGFTDQESNFKSGDYDFSRYNLRSNIDARVTDNLSVSFDFAYRKTVLDKANFFSLDHVFTSANRSKPTYPVVHEADPDKVSYSGWQNNPYSLLFEDISGFIENRENVLQGRLELKYSFPMINGLVAKARLNYEDVFSWDKNVQKPAELWEYDPIKAKDGEDPWIAQGIQGVNHISVYSDRTDKLLPLFSIEYEKTFGKHYVKGMVASETWTTKNRTLNGGRKDILSYEAPYLNYAGQEGITNAETFEEKARTSFIGRFNYEYSGKYLLEVAMRADASAEYPPEGRWGYFPSVSAGWRISEESFLKDSPALNSLKLRGSYGILGNDAVSSFDYLTGYNITGKYYVFGASAFPAINSAGLANRNITWETEKISNIGLDGILWDGLLGFEFDLFYRLREDVLAQPITQVPSTFGASLPRTNLNKQDNRGFEISLTHINKIGDFSYNISPMFWWARGKFVDIEENVLPETNDLDEETLEFNRLWNNRYVKEGHWDDRLWGFISDGIFMNQEQIDNHPVDQDQAGNQTLKVGDIIYKDINGDGLIDWRDEQVIGKSGLPKTMYSLDMGASWKGINIRMLWHGGSDYAVTFNSEAAAAFQNESVPLDIHYKYRAIIETDADGKEYVANPDNFKLPPATQAGRTENNKKNSDFWTLDARFLRLKNVNISYTLPKKLLGQSGINQCMFYLNGTNLFTISNLGIWKHSFDPEIIHQGNRNYPPVKTVTFGIKLTI